VLSKSCARRLGKARDANVSPAKRIWKTLLWEKLSNSGNALKLIVLNYIRKVISGWINYSCTVISYKINEKQMGYRGSKSVLLINTVKEQRADGNWCIIPTKKMHLRCALMGFERNYQVKILSNQLNLNKYSFSTLNTQPKLNPWFVSGLADGESSFSISIQKK
jgi:hypothetical protein